MPSCTGKQLNHQIELKSSHPVCSFMEAPSTHTHQTKNMLLVLLQVCMSKLRRIRLFLIYQKNPCHMVDIQMKQFGYHMLTHMENCHHRSIELVCFNLKGNTNQTLFRWNSTRSFSFRIWKWNHLQVTVC